MKLTLEVEILSLSDAAELYPDSFETEDDSIVGYFPNKLDGDSDYNDGPGDMILIIRNETGELVVIQDIAPWIVKGLEKG